MQYLEQLMETPEFDIFMESNSELITEMNEDVDKFLGLMYEYAIQNPDVFIEDNVADMYKNIKVYTEVGLSSFLNELTLINRDRVNIIEPISHENAYDEYL